MDPDFRRGGRIRADYIVTEANAAEIAKLDKTRVIGPSRRLVRTGQPHQPDQTEKAQPTPTTMLVIAALDRIGGGSRAGALCVSETDTSNNLRASFGNEACGAALRSQPTVSPIGYGPRVPAPVCAYRAQCTQPRWDKHSKHHPQNGRRSR